MTNYITQTFYPSNHNTEMFVDIYQVVTTAQTWQPSVFPVYPLKQ